MRICPSCESRELDKFQQKCSECAVISKQHIDCISEHDFRKRNPDYYYDYNRSEGRKKYMRDYMRKYREVV